MMISKKAIAVTLLGAALALETPSLAHAQSRRAIRLPGHAAALPFSDGIVVGNTLYVAGQQGLNQRGEPVAGGIRPQTRAALETIERVVKRAGFQMSDVVAVNVYLAHVHDFAAMNGVYQTFFPNPRPTRTTVQVARLVNRARIEISAIAVKSAR